MLSPAPSKWGLHGDLAHKKPRPRKNKTVALCIGTYRDPKGVGVSYERGIHVNGVYIQTWAGPVGDYSIVLSFRSFRFFELPAWADTGTCPVEKKCFLSDHIKPPCTEDRGRNRLNGILNRATHQLLDDCLHQRQDIESSLLATYWSESTYASR